MSADFITSNSPIPTSSSSSTTTSIDHHSPIGATVLVSVVALFLICSLFFFAQHYFACHHNNQATATPARQRVSVVAPPQPGMDAAAVAALPVVRYSGSGGGEGCAVCLVEYGEREKVKVIPGCGHGFHSKCIDTWLILKGSCPVCRCSEMWGPWSGEVSVAVGVGGCGEGMLVGR